MSKKLKEGSNTMQPLFRSFRLSSEPSSDAGVAVGVVDRETRTVTFSCSSEEPVPMYFGDEILSHAPGACDLSRMNSGGALLFNHDTGDLLGVVVRAWIGSDRRCYVTVRFGRDERGEWAMGQVDDGILTNVSVRYVTHEYTYDVDADIYTSTKWQMLEVSFVTIPADASVGVGRSANQENQVVVRSKNPAVADNQEGNDMSKKKYVLREAAEVATSASAPTVVAVDPAKVETDRVAEIEAMCREHKIPDEVRNSLVVLKAPIEQARGHVLNIMLARNNGAASLAAGANPDLTEKEKSRYSLLRAINASMKQRLGENTPWKDAGFEREVSVSIAKAAGKETAGIFMPTNIPFYAARAADYSYGTGAGLSATNGGANLVATDLMSGNFIELLRNKVRVMQLGAQMLSGLVGNVDIPRQKAAGSTYWVGEAGGLPQSGAQFDKISLSPKHLGLITAITRNMLLQASPDVEMLARADLLATMALGLDAAILYGSGNGYQPLGIANQAGIGSIIGGTNGGVLTIDNLIDMETLVAQNNADEGSMAYLANAKAVGALKKMKSGTGQYLWTNSPQGQRSGTPGEINGYTVARTNQARGNLTKGTGTNLSEIYFGDWSQVLVGEWGVVEILPNPYAAGIYEQGGLELRVLQTVDVGVRHSQSFAIMSDAITN